MGILLFLYPFDGRGRIKSNTNNTATTTVKRQRLCRTELLKN